MAPRRRKRSFEQFVSDRGGDAEMGSNGFGIAATLARLQAPEAHPSETVSSNSPGETKPDEDNGDWQKVERGSEKKKQKGKARK